MTPRDIRPLRIRRLLAHEADALRAHLLALAPEDRHWRFGGHLTDAAIDAYLAALDLDADAVFVASASTAPRHAAGTPSSTDATVLGAAHLARGNGYAELGVSVLDAWHRRGIGSALLRRCYAQCQAWQVSELFVHTASDNHAMLALARRAGMHTVVDGREADGFFAVPSSAVLARVA